VSRTGIFPVLFFAALAARPAASEAQFVVRSWLPWRTIETEHFAFHYPLELEAWTRHVASRMEAIDSAVTREVGYAPPHKTHIVVDDPYETSNGSAWPFLNQPVINLWATPPDPRDDIGEYRDWGPTLVAHEFTHIAHLARPSRNAFMRHLWETLPVNLGPIPIRTPRWVIEGYATYVEGRVTGSGRPHGTWRPAMLRQWAIEGQLPRYEQLDAWGAYAGGEFAYLAGSAFIEWLVDRQGPSSLDHLWRRMSAVQDRGFDEAFGGVFGESARVLYGRFSAELTAKAMVAQRLTAAAGDTGAVVQRLAWGTGDPAISPDGRRVAIVLRSPALPSRVVIWRTAPEPDTGKTKRDSLLLKRDSADVPARAIHPPPKRALATLQASAGSPYESPRFLTDGRVLLWRFMPRGDGSRTSDLFIWDPRTSGVRRVTRNASVRDADPTPDGRSALATRCTGGWCSLVWVDLTTGAVSVLAAGGTNASYYRPRISPDGSHAIVSVHDGERWRLDLVDLVTGETALVPDASGVDRYDVSWASAATVVLVSAEGGVANIERVDLAQSTRHRLTSVSGAAVAPETNRADGSVWFLSLYSRGYDLRRVAARSATAGGVAALDSSLTPAAQIPPRSRTTFRENAVSVPRPFDIGVRQFRWIPVGGADADGVSGGLAVVSTDLIGRSELSATGELGDASRWRGGAVGLVWRGTRPSLRAQVFGAEQRLSESRSAQPRSVALDTRLTGALVLADGFTDANTWVGRYRVGASEGRADHLGRTGSDTATTSSQRALVFSEVGAGWVQRSGAATTNESLAASIASGRSFGANFTRGLATAAVASAGRTMVPVSASVTYGRVTSTAAPFEAFALGGGPSELLDRSLLSQRVSVAALPAGTAVGSSVLAYRVSISPQPVTMYFWSGSVADAGDTFRSWHRVLGLEWTQLIGAIPLAGTPAARVQLGVGESFDAPFRRKARVYLSLILNP
jgi:hypothetical protein